MVVVLLDRDQPSRNGEYGFLFPQLPASPLGENKRKEDCREGVRVRDEDVAPRLFTHLRLSG